MIEDLPLFADLPVAPVRERAPAPLFVPKLSHPATLCCRCKKRLAQLEGRYWSDTTHGWVCDACSGTHDPGPR